MDLLFPWYANHMYFSCVVIMNLEKEDVGCLHNILHNFGLVTGLTTNFDKSLVAPIRWEGIKSDYVLHYILAVRSTFPMTYLGLPLSLGRLRHVDLQPLDDKLARKPAPWQGKHAMVAGRGVLVKLCPYISAYLPHHFSQDEREGANLSFLKIHQSFLWVSCDKASGDKCKVN